MNTLKTKLLGQVGKHTDTHTHKVLNGILKCAVFHLAKTILTTAELLALLQLHTLQKLSQHPSVLQL